MRYKGYESAVSLDDESNIFPGEVVNTKDVITFQGFSTDELRKALEDYLAFCKEPGKASG